MSTWDNALPFNTPFASPESRTVGYKFVPRSSDVIISTPPKCGTTWMMQIVHSLRSRGDLDYVDMLTVVPWLEVANDMGITDLSADQRDTPKGAGKYIVIVRDPLDAAISYYNMYAGWRFAPGSVDIKTFVDAMYLNRGIPPTHEKDASIWQFILSWYPHRKDENVLFLHFEDLRENMEYVVNLVSDFVGIGKDDPELMKIVMEQSSFQFMKEHQTKFNDNVLKRLRNPTVGLPEDAGLQESNSKIRTGKVGSSKSELTPEVQKELEDRWVEDVGKALGFATYKEFRQANNKELNRTPYL